jgi:hypothetical protein
MPRQVKRQLVCRLPLSCQKRQGNGSDILNKTGAIRRTPLLRISAICNS